MNDRLRKVIALMDSSADSEAAAAFRKARELLHHDGRKFRDLLAGTGNGPGANGHTPADAELHALRQRVAELEWDLEETKGRAQSAHNGLDIVERHLDGVDRKYKTALDQKDKAIARLRRQLAQTARRDGADDTAAGRPDDAVRPVGPRSARRDRR